MSSTPPKSNGADDSASRATLRVKSPSAASDAAPAARPYGPRSGGAPRGGPSGAGRRDDRRPAGPRRDDREGFAPRGDRADRPARDDRGSRPYAPRDAQGGRDGGGFGRAERPYAPRGDREGFAPRGDREGFAPRGERPARDDRAPRPYAPRDGQGGRDGGGFGRPDRAERPYAPRGDREGFAPRGDREGFAPRGERPARDDRAPRPYAPRDGQGGRDGGGFGRPDRAERPYAPRGDREGFAPRGDREGFAPRGDRPARDDRAPRPYAPRDGQGGRDGGGFGRPDRAERPYAPRGDREGFASRGDREGFAPRGDRPARDDRAPRPYAPRDGQGGRDGGGFGRPDRGDRPAPRGDREGFAPRGDRPARDDRGPRRDDRAAAPRGDRAERRPYGSDRAPAHDGRSRDDYRAERRAGPQPGEERTYGSIRTYRAPEGLGGKAAPVKITRPDPVEPREDARPGDSRINKRMAELGMCSRREADEWVENGWVKVNGVVAVMGQLVIPSDRIEIERAAQDRQDQQVTILMHKPMGYVSGQAEDGHEPAVALINPLSRWNHDTSKTHFNFSQLKGLAPCGRLDIDSVGLLVLTQDGRVARQIIGEESVMDKEYLVRVTYGDREVDVQSAFPADQLARLRHGLELDGEPLQPAEVEWQNPEQLRFVLTEGKKRQIRRMCEQVGLHVVGLKRIRIGKVVLGNLPVGQWRYLGADESF